MSDTPRYELQVRETLSSSGFVWKNRVCDSESGHCDESDQEYWTRKEAVEAGREHIAYREHYDRVMEGDWERVES